MSETELRTSLAAWIGEECANALTCRLGSKPSLKPDQIVLLWATCTPPNHDASPPPLSGFAFVVVMSTVDTTTLDESDDELYLNDTNLLSPEILMQVSGSEVYCNTHNSSRYS
jgi:hypothetical protein